MSIEQNIRHRILRGLALNRTPGYHYMGNFLDFSFDHVAERDVRMKMQVGPHCAEAHGNISYSSIAVFVDIALAANVRAGHTPASRLATVQMNLQFTGAPMTGQILPWLERMSTTATVLIADPGRAYLPRQGLSELARFLVPTTIELEDRLERLVTLWKLGPR